MSSMPRATAYKPRADRTGLPLVLVECTGCGRRFTSGASSRTKCPDCGRNLRVHRAPRNRRPAVVQPRPEKQIRPAPVRQAPAFSPAPAAPPPAAAVEAVVDDDGMTYCNDPAGQLVPAVWNGSAWMPATPAALAAFYLGWQLAPNDAEICQVIKDGQRCSDEIRHHVDGRRPRDMVWICSRHNDELGKLLNRG